MRLALVLAAPALLLACRSEHVFREMDPSLNRMLVQPRYNAYKSSTFFADGSAMRTPPPGTEPYRSAPGDPIIESGFDQGQTVRRIPMPLTRALLERGRERFEVFCAPCHGVLGDGNTVIASHMRRPPPSLHEPRIREYDDGHVFRVITGGYGFMPPYAAQLEPRDRWAIIAYVRALELSQNAKIADLPPPIAAELREATR